MQEWNRKAQSLRLVPDLLPSSKLSAHFMLKPNLCPCSQVSSSSGEVLVFACCPHGHCLPTQGLLFAYSLDWCSFFQIYLFLAVLGLCHFAGFSLVVASEGYSPVAVRGLLIAVASLVAKHRLTGTQPSVTALCGLHSRSSRAPELRLSTCGSWA